MASKLQMVPAGLLLVVCAAVSATGTEPVRCSEGGSSCPENQTCGGKCGPGVCCDLKELHCSKGGSWCPPGQTCGGPVCGPGPRCCDPAVAGLLQRPVVVSGPFTLPPGVTFNSSRAVSSRPLPTPTRRRCRPGTKCIDNFPCEQGGGSCPPGQSCGGACGDHTCCTPPSSACGEGGTECPAGYSCRQCPLQRGFCCFSNCDHPGAYVAEPCGVNDICLPCEEPNGDKLCCLSRPKTLEECQHQCRQERGKECYLFGCPQGGGWCCRYRTPPAVERPTAPVTP